MSTLGIVVAKEKSNRFENKNIYNYKGFPLFWHSVMPMIESKLVDDVVVSTDSNFIKEYCENKSDIKIVWRNKNATMAEEPIINILNYVYKNLDKRYDKILCILANAPGHTHIDIDKSIKLMDENNLNEIRSFNEYGVENGLLLFKESVLLNNKIISTYVGSIVNNTKEIHYKTDLI